MIKQVTYVRRVTGPRKTRVRIGWRAPFFYALLLLATVLLGLWVDKKWEKAEFDYFMHHAM